jgi:hypothetical protein
VTGVNDFMKTNPHTKLEGQRLLPAAPLLDGIRASCCALGRQLSQILVKRLDRNLILLRRRMRRTQKQLILKTRYLRLLSEYLALQAKVFFGECRIAHLRLTLFLVDHGFCEWFEHLPSNVQSSGTRDQMM